MKEKINGTLYRCDGCGAPRVVRADGVPPNGYHGTAMLVTTTYESASVEWYADKPGCIELAVKNASAGHRS